MIISPHMEATTTKIVSFLRNHPNSSARQIRNSIDVSKTEINGILYSKQGILFEKKGFTPPLWRNIGDSDVSSNFPNEINLKIAPENFKHDDDNAAYNMEPSSSIDPSTSQCPACGQVVQSDGRCGCS